MRFLDRRDSFYVLDIERFQVRHPAGVPDTTAALRLTPLPGEGRAQPQASTGRSDEGLPGQPVLSSDTNEGSAESAPPNSNDTPPGGPDDDVAPPNDTDGTAPEDAADPVSGEAELAIMVTSPAGLVGVTEVSPGQLFMIQANFATAPQDEAITAQLSLAEGHSMDVTLTRDGSTTYRSGIIRMSGQTGGDQ